MQDQQHESTPPRSAATPLSEADQKWDRFVETKESAGFAQTAWWANFLFTYGWDHFGFTVSDEDEIVGGARILRYEFEPGLSYYYIPEGPVLPSDRGDAEAVFQILMEFLEDRRQQESQTVSHVRLETRWLEAPAFVSNFLRARDWLEPRYTLYVNLTGTPEVILLGMKPKGRYNVRLARKHGVDVVEDNSVSAVDDFCAIYQETMGRHEMRGKSRKYFQSLIPYLVSIGRGSLFFAEYQGMRLATALVTYFGERATYSFGGSRDVHRNVMAAYLLHYEIMLDAKARGHHWYDMYGLAPPDKPNDSWAAISAFKRKFGGQEVEFVRSLDYVYDESAYSAFLEYRRARYRRNQ